MQKGLGFEIVVIVGDNSSSFAIVIWVVAIVIFFAFHLSCLSASRCHGKHKGYLRTIEQNANFGRTQDHLSISKISTKQGKSRHNNNNDDDDDGVVHSPHAAVMEQRMSTYSPV